jgi:hypothetical protein
MSSELLQSSRNNFAVYPGLICLYPSVYESVNTPNGIISCLAVGNMLADMLFILHSNCPKCYA